MENYSYNSYPESGDSSPHSREMDFENPPPWDDQIQNNSYKVKFMCSYGGKIQPRSHDNQLSYVGGETKILSVDRNIKFNLFLSKLNSLSDSDVTFKYQLPGEELDALISVTNDDDLEHMMHEYDRLFRASAKPARMRLFLFQVNSDPGFASSDSVRSDREGFVDGFNSGFDRTAEPVKVSAPNNVDFLFGLEKGVPPPPPPVAVKVHDPVPEPVAPPPEFAVRAYPGDRNPIEFQRQVQELQRLQIAEQHEQAVYRRRSDENQGGGGYTGDYYVHKVIEKTPPVTAQPTATAPTGYWPENQLSSGGFPTTATAQPVAAHDQPMYVISTSGAVYHTPQQPHMVRPVTGPTSQGHQGYYAVPRMASDVYREQPVYNVIPPLSAQPQPTLPQQPPPKIGGYTDGTGIVRPSGGAMPSDTGAYTRVAYDSATGRHVYYTTPGGAVAVPPTYQGLTAAVSGDIRQGGPLGHDGKPVTKVPQG